MAPHHFVTTLLATTLANAGGYTASVVPTRVTLAQNEGFVIEGAFGNPAGCAKGNAIFVRTDHPQYKVLYATAVGAVFAKQRIYAFINNCASSIWYGSSLNALDVGGAFATDAP